MIGAVVWDFHATLADVTPVLHYLAQGNYDAFYEESLKCHPILPTVNAARQSANLGQSNLLFTGMPDRYRDGLQEWLDEHDVPMSYVAMRTPEDKFAKDYIIKRRMYAEAVNKGFYVIRAWDDSPAVLDLWARLGVETVEMPRLEIAQQVDNTRAAS